MTEKICTKCKITKNSDCFTVDRQRKDGLYPQCRQCRSIYVKSEHVKLRERARYPSRAEKLKAYLKQKYQEDPEKIKARVALYRKNFADRHRLHSLRWAKNNRARANQIHAKYKLSQKIATPKWLTKQHKKEIRDKYIEASRLGLTVDHIIPVQGKNVSGLHVPWNLQILTLEENRRKGNRSEG